MHICRFLMQAKKKNITAYEPKTLTCFLRSIHRYLNNQNSPTNIFNDQAFNKAREVLPAKRKEEVREHAKGNRHQAVRELTEVEECELFRVVQFSSAISEALWRSCMVAARKISVFVPETKVDV